MPALKTIEERSKIIERLESDIVSDEAQILAYESELKSLVENLKQKHGYNAVSERLLVSRSKLAMYKDEQARDAAFLAIGAVYALLDADPGRLEEFLGWLSGRWHIVEEHNDSVDGPGYFAAFGAFVDNVCRNQWWDEKKYEILDDGSYRIEQDQRYLKDPCIALTLPAGILFDPAPFLADINSFTETAANDWARDYVSRNAGRTAKLDALRKALEKGVKA